MAGVWRGRKTALPLTTRPSSLRLLNWAGKRLGRRSILFVGTLCFSTPSIDSYGLEGKFFLILCLRLVEKQLSLPPNKQSGDTKLIFHLTVHRSKQWHLSPPYNARTTQSTSLAKRGVPNNRLPGSPFSPRYARGRGTSLAGCACRFQRTKGRPVRGEHALQSTSWCALKPIDWHPSCWHNMITRVRDGILDNWSRCALRKGSSAGLESTAMSGLAPGPRESEEQGRSSCSCWLGKACTLTCSAPRYALSNGGRPTNNIATQARFVIEIEYA